MIDEGVKEMKEKDEEEGQAKVKEKGEERTLVEVERPFFFKVLLDVGCEFVPCDLEILDAEEV